MSQILLHVKNVLLETQNHSNEGIISGDGQWTSKIMADLTRIGYDCDYWVHSKPNTVDPTIIEWLYDMTWYSSSDPTGLEMNSLELILECEWNPKNAEIKYDFYKVLQGKARNKVFIFQSKNPKEKLEHFVSVITNSSFFSPNESFLLACWNDDSGFVFSEIPC